MKKGVLIIILILIAYTILGCTSDNYDKIEQNENKDTVSNDVLVPPSLPSDELDNQEINKDIQNDNMDVLVPPALPEE